MVGVHKDVGFTFDSKDLERTKFFNMDGGQAVHVDVWVESYDDQRFWLAHFPRTQKFKFFPKSPDKKKGTDNKRSTGCDRLLKLEKTGVIKLGCSQIFCLDSDDSHLKAALPGYTSLKHPRPHVYTTLAYSMENVILQPDLLDRTFETVTGTSVAAMKTKPSDMLMQISRICHRALLLVTFYEVELKAPKDGKTYKARLLAALDSLAKFNPQVEIKSCKVFKAFITELGDLCSDIVSFVIANKKDAELTAYEENVLKLGYSPDNAYLFAKGHALYDAVIKSLTAMGDHIRVVEAQSLKSQFPDYEERVRCLESQWPNFDHSLKSAYLASLPDVAFFRECRARISADYS